MLPLLAMGRDVPGGTMELDGDSLTLDWNPDGASSSYFSFVERCARALANKLGGEPCDRGWRGRLLPGRGTCAHPLGGCRMGNTENEGVIGTDGQVFGCDGLFVADGAVMPGPVGPNPSLTIGAVSHLIAGHAARKGTSHDRGTLDGTICGPARIRAGDRLQRRADGERRPGRDDGDAGLVRRRRPLDP